MRHKQERTRDGKQSPRCVLAHSSFAVPSLARIRQNRKPHRTPDEQATGTRTRRHQSRDEKTSNRTTNKRTRHDTTKRTQEQDGEAARGVSVRQKCHYKPTRADLRAFAKQTAVGVGRDKNKPVKRKWAPQTKPDRPTDTKTDRKMPYRQRKTSKPPRNQAAWRDEKAKRTRTDTNKQNTKNNQFE